MPSSKPLSAGTASKGDGGGPAENKSSNRSRKRSAPLEGRENRPADDAGEDEEIPAVPAAARDAFAERLTQVLGVLFGMASLRTLWEQDIWWQVPSPPAPGPPPRRTAPPSPGPPPPPPRRRARPQVRAGEHIIDTRSMITTDSWSYTVPGVEWKNVQWLSTVALALVHRTSAVAGLVVLRGVCAGVLFVLLAEIAREVPSPGGDGPPRPAGDAARAVAAAVAMLAMEPRVQVRSELFVMLVFAWGVLRVVRARGGGPPGGAAAATGRGGGAGPAGAWAREWLLGGEREVRGGAAPAPSWRVLWTVLAVNVLAANLHFGLIPFTVLLGGALWMGDSGMLSPGPYLASAAVPLSALAAPHPVYGLGFIWHHVFYFRDKLLTNPDHQRLTLAALRGPRGSSYLAALVVLGGALVGYLTTPPGRR